MGRFALTGGAYQARSIIANAQICANLFPETNPEAAEPPVPVTHYRTPGLTRLNASVGACRAIYKSSNGLVFAVFGSSVYAVASGSYALTHIGDLVASFPATTTPVSISDNGIVCVAVTGKPNDGYVWNLDGSGFAQIADPAFFGSNRVVMLDGWFVFHRIGTNQFYVSPNFWNGTDPFDGTQIASKTNAPDEIISIAVILGNLWLIGAYTTEIWYDAGNLDFPFARQPGVFVAHGCAARYSVTESDVAIAWLGLDRQGKGVVFAGVAYEAKRISNHAVETAIQSYAIISDCISFNYQQGGHTFAVFQFPSANVTWVYDYATEQWHQRTSGANEGRSRANCCTEAYGVVLVGDYQNGALYSWDLTVGTEDGQPIVRRRSFPHAVKNGRRVSYDAFIADMDVSNAWSGSVYLRWSDDRGKTFGNAVAIPRAGTTLDSLILRRLGLARDRVFQLYWSFPEETALNGAFLEATAAET